MKKLLLFFAALMAAGSMMAANFSNGATFTLATSAGVNYAEATVSGINNVTALTSKDSYFHANTSNATFTLDLFDGLIFKSGSTAASTRFYPKYGFYMGQNASTLAIEGTTLAANQEITIYYNVTGTTNDKIKVTNASGTIPNTEGKNVTQTCTVNVINAGQNVEITRNGQ